MKRFFQHWEEWWMGQTKPHTLALFRIGFGLFLCIEALTYLPAVAMLFSNQGLTLSLWPDYAWFLQPPSIAVAWGVYAFYIACTCALAAGWHMRIATGALVVLFLYYWQLSFHLFPSSYHRLFFFTLCVLFFSGADRTWSFYMKQKKGEWGAWEPVSILPQRLLAMQITFTYLGVGWQKILLPAWQSGEVLSYSYLSRWGTPLAYWLVRQNTPLEWYDWQVKIVTLFECCIPFGLWIRKTQWWFFAGGAVFHLSVAFTLGIWWFLVLIPAYVVFLPSHDVERYFQAVLHPRRTENSSS